MTIVTDEQLRVWAENTDPRFHSYGSDTLKLAWAAQAALNARQESEGRLGRIKELELSVARVSGELTAMRQERDALVRGDNELRERIRCLERSPDKCLCDYADGKYAKLYTDCPLHGALASATVREVERDAARQVKSLESEVASLKRAMEHHAPGSCPVCTQVRLLVSPNAGMRGEAIETIRRGLDLLEKLR